MRITDKGQVTVPIELRKALGILPNTEVEFVRSGRNLILRKSGAKKTRGERLIAAMRGKATGKLSTDQIMALTRGRN